MNEPRDHDLDFHDDALLAALTSPREASMVDALFALPSREAAIGPALPSDPLAGGFQSALAAKMRAVLAGRERRQAA